MALIDSDSYRVEGYFEETKLPAIKRRCVEIHMLSGGPALMGHVESISPWNNRPRPTRTARTLASVNPLRMGPSRAADSIRIHIDEIPDTVRIKRGHDLYVIVRRRAMSGLYVALEERDARPGNCSEAK